MAAATNYQGALWSGPPEVRLRTSIPIQSAVDESSRELAGELWSHSRPSITALATAAAAERLVSRSPNEQVAMRLHPQWATALSEARHRILISAYAHYEL